jgi:lysine-N-methylase
VLLHERTTARIHRVTERAWAVLGAMDGTRDAEGLAAAAQLQRFTVTAAEAAELVLDLERAGMLAPDDDPPGVAGPAPPFVPPARPLEVLPRYALACDGAGSCCRLFPTITFLPRDVASARTVLPDVMNACYEEHRAFTPLSGSRHALSVVTLVDGRCGYLERDGKCAIHAASDASFKPFGCRTFPLSFVDDGTSVRVVARPECACVPRSVAGEGGFPGPGAPAEPLLAESVRTRGDLSPEVFVHALPEPVPLAAGATATRADFARWSRAVAAVDTPDAAASFAALASAVATRGLDDEADVRLVTKPPPIDDEAGLALRLERIRAGSARRGEEAFRSPRDLAQQSFVALETACQLALAAPDAFTAGPRNPREAGAESLHLRAMIFGHLLFHLETTQDLVEGLRGAAARVVAARALGAVAEIGELADTAFAWPLSLVEALVRGYALEESETAESAPSNGS